MGSGGGREATLTRPMAACLLCEEERCAEDGASGVEGRRGEGGEAGGGGRGCSSLEGLKSEVFDV